MARAGLGLGWRCLFANDFDPAKAKTYRANWGEEDLREGDVWRLTSADLPGRAELAWASSPCQDFSLAGARAGLGGGRSSAFLGFWRLIETLDEEGRAPRCVVLENVGGLLSSNDGADFAAVCAYFNARGYWFGAVEVDAAALLPQSRPRVFIVATRGPVSAELTGAPGIFHTAAVHQAQGRLPAELKHRWLWWRLAAPPPRHTRLADLLEPDGAVTWRSQQQTRTLLDQMNPLHRARLDGLAGCLRTPGGGSSRQFLVVAENGDICSRLLTAREGARLMGLPDHYRLPKSQSAGLKVVGDGVAVPVVRLLAEQLLEPLLTPGLAIAAAE